MAEDQIPEETLRAQQAYQTLQSIAEQSKRFARGLPAQLDIKPHWSGIGFEMLGRLFVVPMGEVSEMLELPHYTRLPGVKSWIRGVANVRGRLLPICDLAEFLGDRIHSNRKQQRILVLESNDLYTGLLVDKVFGMQHFPVDTFVPHSGVEQTAAAPYCFGSYCVNGGEWAVFSPAGLVDDANFMQAAQA
jgi:twitching motility protein PilI